MVYDILPCCVFLEEKVFYFSLLYKKNMVYKAGNFLLLFFSQINVEWQRACCCVSLVKARPVPNDAYASLPPIVWIIMVHCLHS